MSVVAHIGSRVALPRSVRVALAVYHRSPQRLSTAEILRQTKAVLAKRYDWTGYSDGPKPYGDTDLPRAHVEDRESYLPSDGDDAHPEA